MSKVFDLAGFAGHLATLAIAERIALGHGLERVAQVIEDTAKDKIGEYQGQSGPFGAWAPLAQATEDDKARQGYPLGAPLLREGTLRDSIKHEVSGLEAVIGSESDIAAYQEFGTSTIPPRPFIGPAAVENEKKIVRILGEAAVAGLTGGQAINSALGYDFKTK